MFVLFNLNDKENGFFIEIGAGDGINFSNTYLLEKYFNWNGILIEPSRDFYEKCLESRKCQIENKLLLNRDTVKLKFYEKKVGEFSHSEGFGDVLASEVLSEYYVETIRFKDLFDNFEITPQIDFLSIDTEGCKSSKSGVVVI